MSIPMDSGCMVCTLERFTKKARSLGDEATATAFARELMDLMVTMDPNASSPTLGPQILALLQKYYAVDQDLYREEKEKSNRFVLDRLDAIRSRADRAEDPVLAGLQLAILGNYLDFSALGDKVKFEDLEQMLDKAMEMDLDRQTLAQFKADLARSKRLLYLTDNAGEIGFDRIFAEILHREFPHLEITVCVRGGICQNDATREDAAIVGMPFPVIDNGNDIAGTELPRLGAQARQAMENADVILSKGMGNVETLYGCGRNVYYAFLIKCQRFSRRFGQSLMTPMFIREPK